MHDYLRWAAVTKYIVEGGMARTAAVDKASEDGKGAPRTIWRALESIESRIKDANARELTDEDGRPLPYVEARDLIPTQKFKLLMEELD